MVTLICLALLIFTTTAFAANPFMDVPAGHWSYDAVEQLAARGVIAGYTDGAYRGSQPTTRYEMASLTARTLAQINMEKASAQDVELLKKLVLEFKNELDTLGVKTSDLDKRVAVLEDSIGGWQIRGVFTFSASFSSSDSNTYLYSQGNKKNEFDKEQFRLFLTKRIDENTYFYGQYRAGGDDTGDSGDGRGDQDHMIWSHLYVDTKLPWDMELRVGRFDIDFEDDYGLYTDDTALFGDFRTDGFRLKKNFGSVTATGIIGRNNLYDEEITGVVGTNMLYILNLNWTPSEKFFLGAAGYWSTTDDDAISSVSGDLDMNLYGVYAGYNITPSVALKGIYYFTEYGSGMINILPGGSNTPFEDSPQAWKAILDIGQEALKFTSLWIEYSEQDNSFPGNSGRYAIGGSAYDFAGKNLEIKTSDFMGKSKFLFVKAEQEWNDRWSTYLRYVHADIGTEGIDNASAYGAGVGYQYTPAIYFELGYDLVDHGTNDKTRHPTAINDKESVIRFKTTVSF